jgi:aspartokinase-like uncharacterized kinase
MNPPDKLRVLKLGGSLLSLEDWPDRLRQWLAVQTPARSVLVVGGGKVADVVRELDRDHKLDEFESHWMCIAAMAVNAWRVAEVLSVRVSGAQDLLASPNVYELCVIDPWRFLRDEECHLVAEPLPVGWHVTSDSIAARVAHVMHADELVLLKSCLPVSGDMGDLAATGYVDAYFPHATQSLPRVRCIDLRTHTFDECVVSRP